MSVSWPDEAAVAALLPGLHARLPIAVNDFALAVLKPLAAYLHCRRQGDEHDCDSAATEAVMDLIRNPARYNPALGGLFAFLRMAAERDLFNLRQGQRKHYANRESSESVEVAADARNTPPSDSDLSFDDPRLAVEIGGFDATEKAVFELMRAGERATAAYAPVLGIEHLSADEQAAEVKRAKERIMRRLQRAVKEQQ